MRAGWIGRWSRPGWWQTLALVSASAVFALVALQGGAWLLTPPDLPAAPQTVSDQLGITALADALGDATPTGRQVVIGHVEPRQGRDYLPALHASRFNGVTFTPRSGGGGASGHASATATVLYGRKGLAPGVTQVMCYDVNHWLRRGLLNALSDQAVGGSAPVRLWTHSWISDDQAASADILRRVDQLVEEQGVIVVAGVNNGRTPVPAMLASAYNVIAVGQWEGHSSRGYTRVEVAGRSKPDLVAPGGQTSFATPAVAALAARLLEAADAWSIPRGIQPLAVKAALMAGADKPEDWQPGAQGDEAMPAAVNAHAEDALERAAIDGGASGGGVLDGRYGAGRPRLDRSHAILSHRLGDAPMPPAGWDHRHLSTRASLAYRLTLDRPAYRLSVLLTWHRRVDDALDVDVVTGRPIRVFRPRLADLDLQVTRADDTGRPPVVLGVSASRVDNVEHLWLADLPAGRYDLIVTRHDALDESWDYVIAWDARPADAPSAD